MKLAVVVLLYNPDEKVEENILTYSNKCFLVILWDNTPGGSPNVPQIPNAILLHHEHHNMGLGFAYNRATEYAAGHGATHLMTMDQDNFFNDFESYMRNVDSLSDDTSIGIFSPSISGHQGRSIGFNDHVACQTGSIFNILSLTRLGGFNEDFFIGMVDAEIYVHMRDSGYKVFHTGLGELTYLTQVTKKRLVGHNFNIRNDHPLRYYYDSRNQWLFWRIYPYECQPLSKFHFLIGRLKLIFRIILFENRKATKITAIARGTWNGVRNKKIPYKTSML